MEAYSKEIGLFTDVMKEAYKIAAKVGHLNQSTYYEMVGALSKVGFGNFQTVSCIPKYKYTQFKNNRMRPTGIIVIKENKFLLNIFRGIKVNGRCPVGFTVTLICQKPENR